MMNAIVEVRDEHLIARIALIDERQRRIDHFCALGSHAAAVIEHQTDSDGRIFFAELRDHLQLAVLVNPKVLFLKVGNESAFGILHAYVQQHQLSVGRELVFARIVGLVGRLAANKYQR